jgi:hypothetical protein
MSKSLPNLKRLVIVEIENEYGPWDLYGSRPIRVDVQFGLQNEFFLGESANRLWSTAALDYYTNGVRKHWGTHKIPKLEFGALLYRRNNKEVQLLLPRDGEQRRSER